MGHDHQQSSSSGAVVAIVAAVLLVAILGILVVAGVGLFFVKADRMESRAAAFRAVAEELRAEGEVIQSVVQEQRAEATPQIQESNVGAIPAPRLNFEVTLDREGNASIDGEEIGLDELKAQLAKLKDETSNAFSVRINVDPECPVKHVIPVLDVCKKVGDIDFSIESSGGADSSPDEDDADDGSGK